MTRLTIAFFLLLIGFSNIARGENWPQFRGPNGDGVAGEASLATTWSETENVKWKTEIHGMGWSSPVVWGDQIWMTTATEDGKKMYGICVDRHSGKVVHDILIFENEFPRFRHPTNSYASPTPVIEEGRVYLHFGSYGTVCLNTKTGEKIWERRDIECNHWRAPGSSPILDGDRLIVAYDGYDYQFVIGLNKNTGKTEWKQDRNIDYGTDNGDLKKAYSTATVFTHEGRRQVISPSAVESISYDPESGKELWRIRHDGMNAAIRPVYKDGLLYIAAGKGDYMLIAVRPDGNGTVAQKDIVGSMGKGAPQRPAPILHHGLMFIISDSGIATCLDATSGEEVWQTRIGGNFRSSPILAGGLIYASDQDGKTSIFEAGRKFKIVGEGELEIGFQASPAVIGNSLYLKTEKALYCIEELRGTH